MRQKRCPTCGSPRPAVWIDLRGRPYEWDEETRLCPDPFHSDPVPNPPQQDERKPWIVLVCPECFRARPKMLDDGLCHNHTGTPKRMIEMQPVSELQRLQGERDDWRGKYEEQVEANMLDACDECDERREAAEAEAQRLREAVKWARDHAEHIPPEADAAVELAAIGRALRAALSPTPDSEEGG